MDDRDYPNFPSHLVPRSAPGRRALLVLVLLFALVEPPLLYLVANRIEPFVLGMPFLYTYLLALYIALIAVLFWMHRRGV